MKLILVFLLVPSLAQAYLSFGDASDGDCNWTSDSELSKPIYNCSELTIPTGVNITIASSVNSPIQIRVQGNASINGSINVSADGINPGPGGTNGGDCALAQCSGIDGSGSGAGEGGIQGNDDGTSVANSGGGGGGGALIAGTATAGGSGSSAGLGTPGAGGNAGSSSETAASLDTSLLAGLGGGAGGSGESTTNSFNPGFDGGAGAGGLLIIVKGLLDIGSGASFLAVGGTGETGSGVGTDGDGGNGGSGSGGVIYLVSNTSISVNNADVDISGGPATTDTARGDGGRGSDGLFRVDTPGGNISGSFSGTSPTPNQSITSTGITDPLPNYGEETVADSEFVSDLEASCTYKPNQEIIFQALLSFLFMLGLLQVYKLRW